MSGSMKITLAPGSLAARLYGVNRVEEDFSCSYELNRAFEAPLERAGLRVTGRGEAGAPRIVELPQNRFFIATGFLPQLKSASGAPHPLILAYLQAALTFAGSRSRE